MAANNFAMFNGTETVSITKERYDSEKKNPVWCWDYYGGYYSIGYKNFPNGCSMKAAMPSTNPIVFSWTTRDGVISTGKLETVLAEKSYNFTSKQLAVVKAQKAESARVADLERELSYYKDRVKTLQETVYALQAEVRDLVKETDNGWDSDEDSNWSDGE